MREGLLPVGEGTSRLVCEPQEDPCQGHSRSNHHDEKRVPDHRPGGEYKGPCEDDKTPDSPHRAEWWRVWPASKLCPGFQDGGGDLTEQGRNGPE